ncbi:hypothetical protein BGZ65_000398 [Modicella reniformis]|uniref:Uncharacterized protein n=1 Tax=Modicella reniformis TaxID=1440133 RepID=A0A9P6MAC1_9FUNG|nr:hypothetical protein BGZ65_000398 [Modicella reniformis]
MPPKRKLNDDAAVEKDGDTGGSEGDSEGEAGGASHQSREILSSAASSTSTSRRFSIKRVSSGRSSGSSNGSLSSAALVNLRQAYEENWRVYTGQNWVLPSGVTLDEVVYRYVLGLTYESTLHSFVINDVEEILQLAQDPLDKEVLQIALDRPRDDTVWTLPDVEKRYLQLYDMTPALMEEMMWHGGGGVWDAATKKVEDKEEGKDVTTAVLPDKDFCKLTHELANSLFMVYERNKLTIPDFKSESWYRENLWALLHILLNVKNTLSYEPGEYHSRASGHRKNSRRKTAQEKQQVGRKTDGIITCVLPALELGAMEAAKEDPAGPKSTKALMDGLKLAKTLKDQIDMIREMLTTGGEEAIRQLATYGLLIAGGTISFYTLQLQDGRFYQFTCQGTVTLPSKWMPDGDNTTCILTVVASLLSFRRQIVDMAVKIRKWTKHNYELPKPAGALCTDIPATIKTPTLSPKPLPTA